MNKVKFKEENSFRLDLFLTKIIDGASRNHIKKMIDEGNVYVNGKKERASYKLKLDDEVSYQELEVKTLDLAPENMHLDIVYEDDNVAVVYKPKGLIVHPGAGVSNSTLVHGLLYQIKNLSSINGVIRPGIVHRIDKDTTGLLLICKNDVAHKKLSEDLKNKNVKRAYYALVDGVIVEDDGIIDAPIGRDPKNRIKMAVVEGGKEAVTTFHVLERFKDKTFVECVLKTGRTHQIRVHMKYINHPVYGDSVYGTKSEGTKNGQYLHAYLLGFNDVVTKEYKEFKYELPEYFKDYLDDLRKGIRK